MHQAKNIRKLQKNIHSTLTFLLSASALQPCDPHPLHNSFLCEQVNNACLSRATVGYVFDGCCDESIESTGKAYKAWTLRGVSAHLCFYNNHPTDCVCLDCERKPEHSQRTQAHQIGFKPRTFLLSVNSANHSDTVPQYCPKLVLCS